MITKQINSKFSQTLSMLMPMKRPLIEFLTKENMLIEKTKLIKKIKNYNWPPIFPNMSTIYQQVKINHPIKEKLFHKRKENTYLISRRLVMNIIGQISIKYTN